MQYRKNTFLYSKSIICASPETLQMLSIQEFWLKALLRNDPFIIGLGGFCLHMYILNDSSSGDNIDDSLGLFFRFPMEFHSVAHADKFLHQDCDRNCSKVSEKATGKGDCRVD